MNELIRIIPDEQGLSVPSARELFEFLGFNKTHWSRWSKKNIVDNPFAVEGTDWVGFTIMANGNQTTDYAISIDFAKKLSMKAPTEKGEAVRQYFVEAEKTLQKVLTQSNEQSILQLVTEQTRLLSDQSQMIAQLRADVERMQTNRPLLELPPEPLPLETTRIKIQRLINGYCRARGISQQDVWRLVYDRLYYLYKVNIRAHKRIGRQSWLDIAESKGHIEKIYAIVSAELRVDDHQPVSTVKALPAPIRKPTLETMSEEILQAILRRTFYQDDSLRYAQLRANLMEASEAVGLVLAKTRAEVFISRAVKLSYLLKSWEAGQRYERYRLNLDRFPR